MPAEVIHTTTHVQKSTPQFNSTLQTRVRAETTGVGEGLELNAQYFISIAGLLKLAQIVIAIICMICISPPLTWFSRLFTFVIAMSFMLTVLLTFSYLVSLKNVFFPRFNWHCAEMTYSVTLSLSYLVTAIIHLVLTADNTYYGSIYFYGYYGGYVAAGVFGLLNFFAYGGSAYLLWMELKENKSTNNNAVGPA